MTDEMEKVESGSNVESGVDYIEAIKELKQNTVAKEEYEKLKGENKKLLNSLINGETIDAEQSKPVDIGELRAKLFNEDCDTFNLDYAENALKLRDAVIAEGGKDPFLPWGQQITPSQEDIETAERVASVLKECVEYADGDPSVFTNELMRRTIDTPRAKRK